MSFLRMNSLLVVVFVVVLAMSLCFGQHVFPPSQWIKALISPEKDVLDLIFTEFRLPRTLAAALIGGSLALAGTVTQSVLRNPISEPGILGASSGCNSAITLAMMFQFHQSANLWLVPSLGVLGGMILVLTVVTIALKRGLASANSLVLAGIAISSAVTALTLILSLSIDRTTYSHAVAWMAGSIGRANWTYVAVLFGSALFAFGSFFAQSHTLDIAQLQDEASIGLGLRPIASRLCMLLLASFVESLTTALVGAFPFVGIVAPNIGRLLTSGVHSRLIVVSPLIGAILVITADLIGRTMFGPYEVPAGMIMAVLGGGFFLRLLVKSPTYRS